MQITDTISGAALAEFLDLSRARITQLTTAGVLARNEQRLYQFATSVRAYYEYAFKGQDNGDIPHIDASKAKREFHKALQAEIETERLQAKLVYVDQVKDAWSDVVARLKARLLSLPTVLAADLEGDDIKARKVKLEDAIYGALKEISDYEPGEPQAGNDEMDAEADDASTADESESVGG